MVDKVNVGIIGAGIMGTLRLRSFKKLKNVNVIGVVDINAERAKEVAKKFGVKKWFTDYKELLRNPDLDAVSVATPDFLHRDIVVAAGEAGKHVFCEKPLATTLKDCDDMLDACRKGGVKLMVGFTARFSAAAYALQKLVELGEIGEPIQGYDMINDTIYVPTEMLSWAGKSSPAFFLTVHSADRERWIMGAEAEEVYATTSKKVLKDIGIPTEDFIQAIVYFRNGAKIIFETNWILPNTYPMISENQIKVVGTKGCAYLKPGRPDVIYYTEKGSVSGADMILKVLGLERPQDCIEHFVDCIINDKTPCVTGEDGRAATEIVLAMLKSAEDGKPVKLPLQS